MLQRCKDKDKYLSDNCSVPKKKKVKFFNLTFCNTIFDVLILVKCNF